MEKRIILPPGQSVTIIAPESTRKREEKTSPQDRALEMLKHNIRTFAHTQWEALEHSQSGAFGDDAELYLGARDQGLSLINELQKAKLSEEVIREQLRRGIRESRDGSLEIEKVIDLATRAEDFLRSIALEQEAS